MRLSNIDLNLLVVFETIVRTGSVKRAANELCVSQPAISHALGRLRKTVNDPLFVRGQHGLVPTARAEALGEQVCEILNDIRAALEKGNFSPESSDRIFKIVLSDCTFDFLFPLLLPAWRKTTPDIGLEFAYASADDFSSLEAGDVDCMISSTQAFPKFCNSLVLRSDRYMGAICASHPLAIKATVGGVTLDDYLRYPHACFFRLPGNPVDRAISADRQIRRVIVSRSPLAVGKSVILKTDMILTAPSHVLFDENASGEVIVFELPFEVNPAQQTLLWHRRKQHDPAIIWLRDELARFCRREKSHSVGQVRVA
jgi:DNA-binding transcriptional LysR family regulator